MNHQHDQDQPDDPDTSARPLLESFSHSTRRRRARTLDQGLICNPLANCKGGDETFS
jgi:hypothetical protein